MTTNAWRNRIVGYGEDAPENLLAHPGNWRRHPAEQQAALTGSLSTIGYVQAVIVNKRTAHLVDGHARVEQAMRAGQKSIPIVFIDLSPAEEATILATLDPLAAMATQDDAALTELLRQVQTDNPALQKLLGDIGAEAVLKQADGPEQDPNYRVIVACTDRDDQESLLLRLKSEGYQAEGKE